MSIQKVGKDGLFLRSDNPELPEAKKEAKKASPKKASEFVELKKAPKKSSKSVPLFTYKLTPVEDKLTDLQRFQAHIIGSKQGKAEELAILQALEENKKGKKNYAEIEDLLNKQKIKATKELDEIAKQELIDRFNNDPTYTLNNARNDYNLGRMSAAELTQLGILGTLKSNALDLKNQLKSGRQQAKDLSKATRDEIVRAANFLATNTNITQANATQELIDNARDLTAEQIRTVAQLANEHNETIAQATRELLQNSADLTDAQMRQAQQLAKDLDLSLKASTQIIANKTSPEDIQKMVKETQPVKSEIERVNKNAQDFIERAKSMVESQAITGSSPTTQQFLDTLKNDITSLKNEQKGIFTPETETLFDDMLDLFEETAAEAEETLLREKEETEKGKKPIGKELRELKEEDINQLLKLKANPTGDLKKTTTKHFNFISSLVKTDAKEGEIPQHIIIDGEPINARLLTVFASPTFAGRKQLIANNFGELVKIKKFLENNKSYMNSGFAPVEVKYGDADLTIIGKGLSPAVKEVEKNPKVSVGSSGGVALDTIGGLKLTKKEVANEAKKTIEKIKIIKKEKKQAIDNIKDGETSTGVITQNLPDTLEPIKKKGLRFGNTPSTEKAIKIMNKSMDIAEGGDPILAMDILDAIPEKEYTKKDYLNAYQYISQFIM